MSDRDVTIRIHAVGMELADRLRLEARFLSDVMNLHETAETMRSAADEIAGLTAERDEARSLHQELIFQVGKRFRGETRHQTAKRYICEHEEHCGQGGPYEVRRG